MNKKAVEITNDIVNIYWFNSNLNNLNKEYSNLIKSNVEVYRYKWKYEDYANFEDFQNGLNPQNFLIDYDNYNININNLIITEDWKKFIIKNVTLINPDNCFNKFWQILSFESV